jgi:hypothetical protein
VLPRTRKFGVVLVDPTIKIVFYYTSLSHSHLNSIDYASENSPRPSYRCIKAPHRQQLGKVQGSMQSNHPVNELKRDRRNHSALDLLETILHRDVPDRKDLNVLFGNLAPMIASHLEKHFEAFPMWKVKIRKHHSDPSVIIRARVTLEKNLHHAKLQSSILND